MRDKQEKQEAILKEMNIPFKVKSVYEKINKYDLLKRGKKYYCGKCGKLFKDEAKSNLPRECTCNVKYEKAPKNNKSGYVSNSIYYDVPTVVNGYQIIRRFVVWSNQEIGKEVEYCCSEVSRTLIDSKGKIMFARKDIKCIFYYWDWVLNSPIVIRTSMQDKYDTFAISATGRKAAYLEYFNFKESEKAIKEIRKQLRTANWHLCIPVNQLSMIKLYLSKQTFFETLMQLKRYDLIYMLERHPQFEKQIMILARKNIHPSLDLIYSRSLKEYWDLCKTFNKDLNNPTVVYPNNFAEENAKLERKNNKVKEAKALKDNIKDFNEEYVKRVSKYLNVDFGLKGYSITILNDVKAFYDEGTTMHHCVYRAEYYKKPNSLVFSIKKDGTRVETCEVVIDKKERTASIAQCYGWGDKFTPQHKQIVNIIKKQLNNIYQVGV